MDFVEKVVGKADNTVKEISKDMDGQIYVKADVAVQTEKKIPFPVNMDRKSDAQNKVEQSQRESTATVRRSIVKQKKEEAKSVPVETKYSETERLPHPKLSVFAKEYPRLKEIDRKLKDQNNAIFGCEKKRDKLKMELSECTGIFKGGRRKELQQEIDNIDVQISNMKKRLSSIVREYKFDSVKAFYKEFNVAKKEYFDYQAACAEWEKTCENRAENSMSIRDKLKQKDIGVR